MELRYRGATYQASNHYINKVKSGITVQFLGKPYTLRQNKDRVTSESDLCKYRGVIYSRTKLS